MVVNATVFCSRLFVRDIIPLENNQIPAPHKRVCIEESPTFRFHILLAIQDIQLKAFCVLFADVLMPSSFSERFSTAFIFIFTRLLIAIAIF